MIDNRSTCHQSETVTRTVRSPGQTHKPRHPSPLPQSLTHVSHVSLLPRVHLKSLRRPGDPSLGDRPMMPALLTRRGWNGIGESPWDETPVSPPDSTAVHFDEVVTIPHLRNNTISLPSASSMILDGHTLSHMQPRKRMSLGIEVSFYLGLVVLHLLLHLVSSALPFFGERASMGWRRVPNRSPEQQLCR